MAKAKNSSDSTIKFLIYVLLFLIFILLMLLLLIIPSIKHYKAKKVDYRTYVSQNKHLSKKQVELSKNIKRYKEQNSELLKSFSQEFNQTMFLTFAKNYFSDVNLSEGGVDKVATQFKEYTFSATSHAKTPVDFYKFIDGLKTYPAIVKINFPITLVSKNQQIYIDFNMSIYKKSY
jgi:cell division protein FtsB